MKKLLLFITLFITGCTQYNDLDELTIIKSIGISYDNNYTVYAQIIDDIDENNEAHMKVIEGKGRTIIEGFNDLKNFINKDISFSHVDLLVLDKNLNSNNYDDIMNFFINNDQFRNDFDCIFSPSVKKLLEESKYDEIEIFFKTFKNPRIITKNLNNMLEEYLNSQKIALPNIEYNDKLSYQGIFEYKGERNV